MSTLTRPSSLTPKTGVRKFLRSKFFKRSDTTLFILVAIITIIAAATLGDFRTLSNLSNLKGIDQECIAQA